MPPVFDPDHLHQIARASLGQPIDRIAEHIIAEVANTYPGWTRRQPDWVFSIFGNTTGTLCVLHGSLTEYLILYGSAIGTEGFSGRYFMEVHDFMLTGTMWTYTEERPTEALRFVPGDHAVLPRGHAKGFRLEPGTWMLEYSRGFIPPSLPFGLGEAVLSAQDAPTIWKTLRGYGGQVIRNLLRGKL
jgi:hypothetical protein